MQFFAIKKIFKSSVHVYILLYENCCWPGVGASRHAFHSFPLLSSVILSLCLHIQKGTTGQWCTLEISVRTAGLPCVGGKSWFSSSPGSWRSSVRPAWRSWWPPLWIHTSGYCFWLSGESDEIADSTDFADLDWMYFRGASTKRPST